MTRKAEFHIDAGFHQGDPQLLVPLITSEWAFISQI